MSDSEGLVLQRTVTVAHEVTLLAHGLDEVGCSDSRCICYTGNCNGKVLGIGIEFAILSCPVLSDLSEFAVLLISVLNAFSKDLVELVIKSKHV